MFLKQNKSACLRFILSNYAVLLYPVVAVHSLRVAQICRGSKMA